MQNNIDIFRIDQERAASRARYWASLRRAKQEYDDLCGHTEYYDGANGFYYFMQANYGIRPNMSDGKFTDSYQIVDEKKHMLYQIKYAV